MQTFLIDYLHWIIYIYSQSISHLNKHILSQFLSSSTALSTLNMQNIIMIETITFSKEYLLGPKSLQHKCFPNPKGEIQVHARQSDFLPTQRTYISNKNPYLCHASRKNMWIQKKEV